MPRRARALGKAPNTSPSPPVFEKGAHSDPTKSTLSGGGMEWALLRGVEAIVYIWEDVVFRLDVGKPPLVHVTSQEIVVDPSKLQDMRVGPALGVRHRGACSHD